MTILIDGHNLIPHLPGIDLSDLDDEAQLVKRLQDYCRLHRKRVEVFFDRAPAGQAGDRVYGSVRAVFVHEGLTADEVIMARLRKLGRRARNVIVVSSDRQVQQAARAAHARVVSSEAFVGNLKSMAEDEPDFDPRNHPLSDEEVAEWEEFFRTGKQDSA